MRRPKLSWMLMAAGIGVLCFFWFSPSVIEKPANNEKPVADSTGAGTATVVAVPETTSEDISHVSPDSSDSSSSEDVDSEDNSEKSSDNKKKIENLKCISPGFFSPVISIVDLLESPVGFMTDAFCVLIQKYVDWLAAITIAFYGFLLIGDKRSTGSLECALNSCNRFYPLVVSSMADPASAGINHWC